MAIEKHSIDFVPENERHGSARNLFFIWFSANMQMTVIITGALAITYGLNVLWGLIAVVVGNLIGGVFMATHSAQGPELGIPQMIQSRAQFGVIGAVFPLLLVIIVYLGGFVSSGILGAEAIHSPFPSISITWSLILLGGITAVITIFGHDLIHRLERYFSILFIFVFIAATIVVAFLPLPEGSWSISNFHLPTFVLVLSITATWQLTYAPFVADYSRYLPKKTSQWATFGYSYAGSVISCIWMMSLGILLAASIQNFSDNPSGFFASLFGPYAWILYLTIVVGIIAVNVLNLYGAFMAIVTTLASFTELRATTKSRLLLVLITAIVGTALAIFGQEYLMDIFSNFMLFLQYFMIPWSAINLVDFYFVRHGKYNIEAIFDMHGEYGKFNWAAIFTLLITVVLEMPFMNTSIFEGFISKAFEGGDIAWAVGLIAPSIIYYFLMKRRGYNIHTKQGHSEVDRENYT